MGATLTDAPTITVREARRRLADTSRMSAEQVSDLERVITTFHASRPRHVCVACGSAIWSEHEATDGEPVWACRGCHRPASLTQEAWHAQRDAAKANQRAAEAHAAANEPAPADALAAARTLYSEAATTVAALEASATGAQTALTAALGRHADAVAGMQTAEQAAIERAAGQRTARSSDLSVDGARGRLRLAEDGLSAARGARGLIDDRLHYAQSNLTNATAALRTAALRVLAKGELEPLLQQAIEARSAYLEAVGSLGWLILQRAVPANDIRASQLVREASDTPPALFPEATAAAEAPALAARLAELEE
jgi:ribosomal protein L37AE/L43A